MARRRFVTPVTSFGNSVPIQRTRRVYPIGYFGVTTPGDGDFEDPAIHMCASPDNTRPLTRATVVPVNCSNDRRVLPHQNPLQRARQLRRKWNCSFASFQPRILRRSSTVAGVSASSDNFVMPASR